MLPCRAFVAIVASASGCLGSPTVGPALPGGGAGGPSQSFASISETLLTPRCATSACHTGSPPANGVPVSLDAAVAWQELVSVPSIQLPSQNLVEPGSPETSYLVEKLRGTHTLAGGLGQAMPIGDEPLTEEEIQAIEGWISNGAPND